MSHNNYYKNRQQNRNQKQRQQQQNNQQQDKNQFNQQQVEQQIQEQQQQTNQMQVEFQNQQNQQKLNQIQESWQSDEEQQNNFHLEQQQNNKRVALSIIGVAILVIGLVGITYAFFNYTRTGTANTIKTGRIAFNAEEGDTVTLDGLFPITTTGEVTSSTPGVGSLQIHVTGDTTYEEGLEYLVKAVNVTGSNGTSLPISVRIEYAASNNKSIGTADDNYFTNRGGNSSVYKVLSTNTIEDNGDLVVGYIAPGQTGIDGYITIMAWLDAANIAITDTNPEGLVRSVIATNYDNSACETVLDGVTNASTYCATASSLQSAINNGDLQESEITLLVTVGIVEEYTDGTTDAWVAGRTVFTTEEWNAMTANGVSFQVKVESNEGTWVTAPPPTIASCPGCKFMYTTTQYQYGGANNVNATEVSTLTGVTNDYTTLNENYFLGFTETQDGKIDRAFACGIKGENPNQGTAFCIEGSTNASTVTANQTLVNTLYGTYDSETGLGCVNNGSLDCYGSVTTYVYASGNAFVGLDGDMGGCSVNDANQLYCY